MKFEGKKILFLTISRSGHHAVINWLTHQCKGVVKYYNNCMLGWENGKLETLKKNNLKIYNISSHNITTHIYTIEEFEMPDFEKYNFNDLDIDLVIIINRDFKNWVASCIKGEGESKNRLLEPHKTCRNEIKKGNIFMWEGLIKESLNLTNYINNKYHINYNKWFTDIEYRKQISTYLNLDFNDSKLSEVSRYGGGSSFNGLKISNGRNLNVLKRYKSMSHHHLYKKSMEYPHLIELDNQYFKKI